MVKKDIAEKWVVRSAEDRWLGTFFFDEDNGQISIQSEWGAYHHWWSKGGRGTEKLTEFLAGCDDYYLMDKFSYGTNRWFDRDKTIAQIREDITKAYGKNTEYSFEIDELESAISDSGENYFDVLYSECDALVQHYGDHEKFPYFEDFHPRLRAFMKECWPLFIEGIKKGVSNETVSV